MRTRSSMILFTTTMRSLFRLSSSGLTVEEIIRTAPVFLFHYIYLILFPFRPCVEYYTPVSSSWMAPVFLLSAAGLGIVLILLFLLWRRKSPVLIMAMLFICMLLPFLNASISVVTNRFAYVPSLAACLLMAWTFKKTGDGYGKYFMANNPGNQYTQPQPFMLLRGGLTVTHA